MKLFTTISLLSFVGVAVTLPLLQACNPSIARRAEPNSLTIEQIVSGKICPPKTLFVKVANDHHESIQSFGSFISSAWDSVTSAVTSVVEYIPQYIHDEVFNTPLGYDIIGDWLNKLRDSWSIDKSPTDNTGQTLRFRPPPGKPGLSPTYWVAPWKARRPPLEWTGGQKCGVGTNRLCP